MRNKLARLIGLVGLLVLFGSAPSYAGDAGGVEAHALVQRQLDAFEHGDAEGAYALAAPGLRESYVDSRNFMEMVRVKYAPLIHRRATEFGIFAIDGDTAAQNLVLVDDDGGVWSVVYALTRQPDGSWLVGGVLLMQSDATDA